MEQTGITAHIYAALDFLRVPTLDVFGFETSVLGLLAMVFIVWIALVAVRVTRLWRKVAILVLLPIALSGVALAMVGQLSYSRPLSLDWLQAQGEDGVRVEAAVSHPPTEIVVMLLIEQESRMFTLPWSEALEDSLRAAQQRQREHGGGLRLRLPSYERSLRPDPKFYDLPPPAPAPKDGPQRPLDPFEFEA